MSECHSTYHQPGCSISHFQVLRAIYHALKILNTCHIIICSGQRRNCKRIADCLDGLSALSLFFRFNGQRLHIKISWIVVIWTGMSQTEIIKQIWSSYDEFQSQNSLLLEESCGFIYRAQESDSPWNYRLKFRENSKFNYLILTFSHQQNFVEHWKDLRGRLVNC